MDILQNKSDFELSQSILAETAKATNELKCARNDIEKAQSRLSFVIALTNELINRKKD
jgi:hypothetical protein